MTLNATTGVNNHNYRVVPLHAIQQQNRTFFGHNPGQGGVVHPLMYNNQIEMAKQQQLISLAQDQAKREAYFNPTTRPDIDFECNGGFFGSLWRCGKNFIKGGTTGFLKSAYRGIFCNENGEFSLGKTFKSALMIGGMAALSVVCPVAGLGIASYYLVKSGSSLVKTASNCIGNLASGNYEKAEEQAFLAGENATGTALSAWGTMSALKGVQGSAAKSYGEMLKSPWQTVKNIKTELFKGDNWRNGWENIKSKLSHPFKKDANVDVTPENNNTSQTDVKAQADATSGSTDKTGVAESVKNGVKHVKNKVAEQLNQVKEMPKTVIDNAKILGKEALKADKGIYATAVVSQKDSAEDSLNPDYSKNNPFKLYGNSSVGYPYGAHAQPNQIPANSSYHIASTPAIGVGM